MDVDAKQAELEEKTRLRHLSKPPVSEPRNSAKWQTNFFGCVIREVLKKKPEYQESKKSDREERTLQ